MTIRDTDLYAAAIEATVSKTTGDNCFAKVAIYASACTTMEEFQEGCKNVEDLVKQEFSLKSMPNAWRSAKSVCIGIKTLGLEFYHTGELKGKTELQRVIRESKKTVELPTIDKLSELRGKISDIYLDTLGMSDSDSFEIKTYVATLWGLS